MRHKSNNTPDLSTKTTQKYSAVLLPEIKKIHVHVYFVVAGSQSVFNYIIFQMASHPQLLWMAQASLAA